MLLKEYIKTHRLIMDGAMGTYFAKLAGGPNPVCEFANLENPDLIRRIHLDYLEAGAGLLRTNTFAAAREILAVGEDEQRAVISAACRIASDAAEEYRSRLIRDGKEAGEVFIAGDIGPIPESADRDEQELAEEYCVIADEMLDAGLNVILFETFAEFSSIRKAARHIKMRDPNVFIIAEFCVDKYGYTRQGFRADRLLWEAAECADIDACGLNCGIGSGHLDRVFGKMKLPDGVVLCAAPNAGYPEQFQSRMSFVNNVKYFCENMEKIAEFGIQILGGCCGTTPSYIEGLSARIVKNRPAVRTRNPEYCGKEQKKEPGRNRFEALFEEKKKSGRKVIAVELDPPYDAADDNIIGCALSLKKSGADIITIADSPMGRSRVDPVLMAVRLAGIAGLPMMPHIACRDRNMIAVRSEFLGAYVNGIRNFLIVTGDPVPSENRRSITGVFDYNSIRLMQFLREMNEEHFKADPVVYGGALNYGQGRLDKVIERMRRKMDAGAGYFLTQPVFSREDVERLREIKAKVDTRILCGIMPLVSYRNANFVKNEIAGIHVPDEIVARYRPDMTKEEAEWTGAEIASEIMEELSPFADGFYFMLPFNRVSLMEKIKL